MRLVLNVIVFFVLGFAFSQAMHVRRANGTSTEVSWTVPAGVTKINIMKDAKSIWTMAVEPGQTFTVKAID